MKSRCDEVRFADEVENCVSVELNPPIAAATSSEPWQGLHLRSRFIPPIQADLIAFASGKCY